MHSCCEIPLCRWDKWSESACANRVSPRAQQRTVTDAGSLQFQPFPHQSPLDENPQGLPSWARSVLVLFALGDGVCVIPSWSCIFRFPLITWRSFCCWHNNSANVNCIQLLSNIGDVSVSQYKYGLIGYVVGFWITTTEAKLVDLPIQLCYTAPP